MKWKFWAQPPPPPRAAEERIEPPPIRAPLAVSPQLLAETARARPPGGPIGTAWTIPEPPPGVLPPGATGMAQDSGISGAYGWAGTSYPMGFGGLGCFFPGYPYLAELQQRSEYRRPVEQIAKEMTRRWIRLVYTGAGDQTKKLAKLDAALKRFGVQAVFCRMAELDGAAGKGQIYLDTGDTDDPAELETPLIMSAAKIKRGGLKRLAVIEPIWTYPAGYNSTDPLHPHYYRPQAWYVMAKKIHRSRLLTFISREVHDILKPAYMFGGLSLSQLAREYVDRWLRDVASVSDLVHSFSVSGLATNMGAALSGGTGAGVVNRVALFNNMRDNSGAFVLDKDTEEWFNVATPLAGLDKLQAQSQEHMASPLGIPLIVLFGITPTGLNASSDGEIAVWQAWVEAQQEHLFRPNLTRVIDVVQLSEFGEIDPDIGFVWEPLGKLDAVALAGIRKSDADSDVALVGANILSPEEVRTRIARAEDTLYPGLDISDLPEIPEPDG